MLFTPKARVSPLQFLPFFLILGHSQRSIIRVFFKFGLFSKIQFESSTSFPRRLTGKTGEIVLADFTING